MVYWEKTFWHTSFFHLTGLLKGSIYGFWFLCFYELYGCACSLCSLFSHFSFTVCFASCCMLFLLFFLRSEEESVEVIGCRYGKDFGQVEEGKRMNRIYHIRKLQLKLKTKQQCLVLILHVMWGMNVRFVISFVLRREKVQCWFFWKIYRLPFRVWNRSPIRV